MVRATVNFTNLYRYNKVYWRRCSSTCRAAPLLSPLTYLESINEEHAYGQAHNSVRDARYLISTKLNQILILSSSPRKG
jgi:hypothetical protein